MSTLMSINYGYGNRPHKCDSRCYDAKGPDCNCICGGKNHGQGFDQALENTKEMASEFLANAITEYNLEEFELKVKMFNGEKLIKVKM